jgi:hypothetical protein
MEKTGSFKRFPERLGQIDGLGIGSKKSSKDPNGEII